jgi:hypothetical protein
VGANHLPEENCSYRLGVILTEQVTTFLAEAEGKVVFFRLSVENIVVASFQ